MLVEVSQIKAHTKLAARWAVGNVLKQPRLLQRKPRSGLFHLDSNLHQQRMAGFQHLLQPGETLRESQQLLDSRHVLNRENSPAGSLLRPHRSVANDQRSDVDLLPIPLALDLIERYYFEIGHSRCVFCQRMSRNVK